MLKRANPGIMMLELFPVVFAVALTQAPLVRVKLPPVVEQTVHVVLLVQLAQLAPQAVQFDTDKKLYDVPVSDCAQLMQAPLGE
jgi:hypothetical protein